MDQQQKTYAIMGCGRISRKHLDAIDRLASSGGELVGVCDIDLEKAKAVGAQKNVRSFSSIDQLVSECRPDVVAVLTESGNHASHVCNLAGKVPTIIVEKPMALTVDDADRMTTSCANHNTNLYVVKQNRYNPPIKALKTALDQGAFGKIVLGTVRVRWCRDQSYYDQAPWRGTWALDGGVIANQACHHVDLLQWMLGPVDSVFAKGSTRLVDIEAEDTAAIILKFRSGALGIVEATTCARPANLEGSISIMGGAGSAEIGGHAANKVKHWHLVDKGCEDTYPESLSEDPNDVYGLGHVEFYKQVHTTLLNDHGGLVDGLEGRKTVEIIAAVYESMETGEEVFLRFQPNKCKLGVRQ